MVAVTCSKIADKLLSRFLHFSVECPNVRVYIQNPKLTLFKMQKMIQAGSRSLQVVSDFDHTMSKYIHDGKIIPSSFGVLCKDPELNESIQLKLRNLHDKYHPVEVDAKTPISERIPLMKSWWQQSRRVITESGLHYDTLRKVVQNCEVTLREGVRQLTFLLNQHNIPMLVFSAGMGDVIDLLLQRFAIKLPNVKVVSNFMIFNDQDTVVGFRDPIIYTFCKTAASITNDHYRELSSTRPCVLLLGDSLGDVHMADGATTDDPEGVLGTVLRVGFLNENVDDHMEMFKSAYDIVIVNDDTFTIPLAIIQAILPQGQ